MKRADHSQRPWGERLIASRWRFLLFPAWLLYRPIIGLRNVAYDAGWFKPKPLKIPVISVGNIIAGGSGKTPLVTLIVSWLKDYRCHVVSRGYKGDGVRNDEAQLMSVPVHCHSQRVIAGKAAIQAGAQVIVLDDGFQHRQLKRNCDIVLIDATRPWGQLDALHGAVLPLGFLREAPNALKRADCLILSRCNQVSTERLARIQQQLHRFQKPLLCCEHRPSHLTCFHQADAARNLEQLPLGDLQTSPVLCVSGIAHPAAFIETASSLNYEVAAQLSYPDHHHYQRSDIESIIAQARSHSAVVLCTSKDAVKLHPCWPKDGPTLYTLHISMHFNDADQQQLKQIILHSIKPI